MHYIWLSIFKVNEITTSIVTSQVCTFLWETDRYQHTELSFIKVNCKVVDKFYAFFTWLIDGLIVASHNCDISKSILWFGLNSSRSCRFVFRSLWFLSWGSKFIWTVFRSRCPEKRQQNSISQISLTFYSWEDSVYGILSKRIAYFLNSLKSV